MSKKQDVSIQNILSAVRKAMRAYGAKCLTPKYRKQKQTDDHYSFGLCYVASEAVMHLAREFNDLNLKPCVGRVADNTHWWLEKSDTGERIDPTKSQFKDMALREKFYAVGRGSGFLTKQPSKRSQILIDHARCHICHL